MRIKSIPNGWYSDLTLRGDFCSLIHNSHIILNDGIVDLPNEDPLFLSIGIRNGVIFLAGQGQASGSCQLYNNSNKKWKSISPTYGINPVAFDKNGLLYIVSAPNKVSTYDPYANTFGQTILIQLGAQGIRCIDNNGNVISADSTNGPQPYSIAKYTELQKGLAIGQSYIDGVTVVYDKRYQIQTGSDCAVIRSYWDGNLIANVTVHQNPTTERAVFQWFTLAELSSFPLEPVPIGPTTPSRTDNGRYYNITNFILTKASLQPRSGPTHPQNEIVASNGLIYDVKFDNPQAYEMFGIDLNWVYELEDASNEVFSFTDQRLYPILMRIGVEHAFVTGQHEIIHRDRTCKELSRGPINRKMWLEAVYDGYEWGPDLGNRPTVVLAYDPTDGFHAPDRMMELNYYSLEAGRCRFEAYRSDLVYQSGKPVFSDEARTARSDFYLLNGPNVQPQLTGCVPQEIPHYPPLTPPMKFDPNVPIGDDQIIELSVVYDVNDTANKDKDLSAYLRDAAYYGFGYYLYRAYGDSHEVAKSKYSAACTPDAYYPNPPEKMPPDDETIYFSQRWMNRYSIIGRLQTQSRVDNARDETYWLIVYYRQRVQGTGIEPALENMENGMAQEAGMPLPYPPTNPTRDDILGLNGGLIHFQGLIVPTQQFGNLPGFEAAMAWLTPEDRKSWWNTKKSVNDTHALVQIPFGPPLYDEPNQPYNKNNFPALDWTNGGTQIDNRLTDLLHDIITNGFNKIFLFLGGDGPNNQPIAMKHLDLLAANDEYHSNLYKYCVVIPGWDSVFYGWEPVTKIQDFGAKFRSIWPNGYLGLEHDMGHIPLGEGGGDYQPNGRMKDFDLVLSEYDQNLHQDTCWQINGRLTRPYNRPPDQPSGDDPNPPYYLITPNSRGAWGHCAFEYGEYQFVRDSNVTIVDQNRSYLKTMGCKFTG